MKKIVLAGLQPQIDSLIDSIDVLIAKADDDLGETLTSEGYVKAKTAVDTVSDIEDALTEALNGHTDEVLAALQDSNSLNDFMVWSWEGIKDEDTLRKAIYDALFQRLKDMLAESTEGFIDAYEPDLLAEHTAEDILTEPAAEFVKNWSEELSRLMKLETNDQIEKILLDAQKDALSVDETALKITESGIRDPGYRSRRVALTEVLRAESYGQIEAMRQCPTVVEKEWHHTGAHKNTPRPGHVAISGQRKKIDEPFDLVGADGVTYHPMVPRDTNLPPGESVNCHCIMQRIQSEEALGMTVEERRALRQKYIDQTNKEWEENDTARKTEEAIFGKDVVEG